MLIKTQTFLWSDSLINVLMGMGCATASLKQWVVNRLTPIQLTTWVEQSGCNGFHVASFSMSYVWTVNRAFQAFVLEAKGPPALLYLPRQD